MRRSLLAALTLIGMLALFADGLSAQGRSHTREGFWISFGLGGGSLGCELCGSRESGGAGYLRLGGTLNPRLLLGFQSIVWVKEEYGATLTVGSAAPVVMFYPSETSGFYLLAGVGVTTVEFEALGLSVSDSGGGGVIGLGYDARVGDNFSLTPFAAAYAGDVASIRWDVVQLGLGITWH